MADWIVGWPTVSLSHEHTNGTPQNCSIGNIQINIRKLFRYHSGAFCFSFQSHVPALGATTRAATFTPSHPRTSYTHSPTCSCSRSLPPSKPKSHTIRVPSENMTTLQQSPLSPTFSEPPTPTTATERKRPQPPQKRTSLNLVFDALRAALASERSVFDECKFMNEKTRRKSSVDKM